MLTIEIKSLLLKGLTLGWLLNNSVISEVDKHSYTSCVLIVAGIFEALSVWLIHKSLANGFQHFNISLDRSIALFLYQVLEKEEDIVDLELKADHGILKPEPEPEQSSKKPHHEIFITEDQDSGSLLPSSDSDSGFAAELEDSPNIQDNIPNRQAIMT